MSLIGSGTDTLGVLAKTHATTLPDVSVGHVLGQAFIALIIIVGGLWVVAKIYAHRRSGRALTRNGASRDGLTVICRQALGKDQQLAVIMWGDRKILVGISGSNITFYNDGLVDDDSIARSLANTDPSPSMENDQGFGSPVLSGNSVSSLLNSPTTPITTNRSLIEKLRDATQRY